MKQNSVDLRSTKVYAGQEKRNLHVVGKKGVVFTRLAPAEVEVFRSAMKNLWNAHTQEMDAPLIAAAGMRSPKK